VTAGQGRRLRQMRPSGTAAIDPYEAAIDELDRRRQLERQAAVAAVAAIDYARELAGTRDTPGHSSAASASREEARRESRAPTRAPGRAPRKPPVEAPRPRPNQHTEVPLEEAMTCPWYDGTAFDPGREPPPTPPGFEPWAPIIPSYAPQQTDKREDADDHG
jgi:hypothetical protein